VTRSDFELLLAKQADACTTEDRRKLLDQAMAAYDSLEKVYQAAVTYERVATDYAFNRARLRDVLGAADDLLESVRESQE
jgi:hypothetical protein